MNRPFMLCVLILTVSHIDICRADLTISTYSPQRNDRYYVGADRAFVADGYDLSGVGKESATPVSDNGSRWATLISPHFALTASHFASSAGSTITFVAGDMPTSPAFAGTIAATETIGGDLQLIRFADAVTGVNPFAIVNDNQSALINQPIFVSGQGNRIGTNNIDGNFGTYAGDGFNATYAYLFQYDPNNGNPNEAQVNGGDSGSPSFVVGVDGKLALVGTHTFIYDEKDSSGHVIATGSGDTYVSHYLPQLQARVAALDAQFGYTDTITTINVRPVPEPGSFALMGIGVISLYVARRSRARGVGVGR